MTIISVSLSYLHKKKKKPSRTDQSRRLLLWKQSSHQLPRDGGVSWRPNDMSKCKAPQQCKLQCHGEEQASHVHEQNNK